MKRFSIVFAASIVLVCAGQVHASIILNGSFETGDISGWENDFPPGATTLVVAAHEEVGPDDMMYAPTDGSYFVLLKTDGPGSNNVLEQAFTVEAGDVVSFDVFFDTIDVAMDPDSDLSTVDISSTLSGSVNLWSVGAEDVDDQGYTPWTSISYTIPIADEYTLTFKIHNAWDSSFDSWMGIDNVVASVPEPATLLIWSVLGVLGIAYGWRRRKTA